MSGARGLWLAVLAAVPVVGSLLVGLNHDVRYALGGLRVSPLPAEATFVHRPLVYRWILPALDIVPDGSRWLAEGAARLVALLLVLGAALLLRHGLAVRLGGERPDNEALDRASAEASAVAVGVGLALALAPSWDFLQPEWIAVVAAVGAVGAALTPRRLLLAGAGGGALLAVAALVRFTTVTTAVIALGVVLAIDRRRALAMLAGAAVFGAVFAGFVARWVPLEWRWVRELPVLDPPNALQAGPAEPYLRAAAASLANEVVVAPLLVLLPAAVVLLARTARTRRERAGWLLLPPLAVLVAVVPLLWQAQWLLYHLAALPVVAAGLWALAAARWYGAGRSLLPLALLTVVAGAGAMIALGAPLAWRLEHGRMVAAGMAAVAVAGLLWVGLSRFGRRPRWPFAAGLAGLVALAVPLAPTSGYSFDARHADYTNTERLRTAEQRSAELAAVRDRIGEDSRVVYFAFGDTVYFLGNRTPCAYPSAIWVQRGASRPEAQETASYRENLACLQMDVEYLVLDPEWLPVDELDREVAGTIRERFDCTLAIEAAGLQICPARP